MLLISDMNLTFDISSKTAIIFCGIQASGKTTFYRQNLADKNVVHINLDTLHTRHREQLLMEECATSGKSVVIDNTNPTQADRKKYITFFRAHNYQIIGIYFQSNVHDCLKRNADREQRVKDLAVLGTFGKLEIPSLSEGYNELYYVQINDNQFTLNSWNDEI